MGIQPGWMRKENGDEIGRGRRVIEWKL